MKPLLKKLVIQTKKRISTGKRSNAYSAEELSRMNQVHTFFTISAEIRFLGLQKHVNKSKLHKENLEKLKHPDVEEDEDETEAYK